MYRLTQTSAVIRIADGASIPLDPENQDYVEYLLWLAGGNAPEPEAAYLANLSLVQAEMWRRIKVYRDLRSDASGYLVSGKWFHSDQKSKVQQVALVLAGASLPPFQWKTMDGSFVTMTPALAVAIFQAAMQKDAEIFGIAEQHKANMMASTDPLSYNYKTGWPQGYGE